MNRKVLIWRTENSYWGWGLIDESYIDNDEEIPMADNLSGFNSANDAAIDYINKYGMFKSTEFEVIEYL